jgi:hypothetical protein
MDFWKFIKPDLKKAKVFIILLLIIFLLNLWWESMFFDYWTLGIPFVFSWVGGPCPPGAKCSGFYPGYLILDIVFWYIASCIIAWAYDKLFTRNKKKR